MKCSSQVWIVALLALNTSGLAWGAKCPQPYFNGFGNSGAPVALASDPILATNDDGHLEVFGLGKDGAVWHSWQDSHSGTWSAWVPFPNPPGVSFPSLLTASGAEGEVTYPQLAVAKDFQGRLQLFIVDGSTVWQVGQVKKNVNWNSWQKLTLGISGSPVGVWATPNADGHPELFIFNRFNGKLVHFWQFNGQTNWLGPAESPFRALIRNWFKVKVDV